MEKKDDKPLTVELITTCPECGSKSIIKDYGRAEIFCAKCGLVIVENIVDLGPEWRAFDSEQTSKRTRTGPGATYRIHDKGLSTLVTWTPTSYGGYKLKKWQQRTHIANTTERSYIFALSEIDRMACALKLPTNIREEASKLYRKAMENHLIRGRSIEGITSAILYIVCRQYKVPRTFEEITEVSRGKQKEINRACRFLSEELRLKMPRASPIDYIPRFCSQLGLSEQIRSEAVEIIKKTTEKKLTNGRGPIGLAAAAIYIAAIMSGEHRTQKEVADVTGVTEPTIRNRYREMSEKLGIDISLG